MCMPLAFSEIFKKVPYAYSGWSSGVYMCSLTISSKEIHSLPATAGISGEGLLI